MHQIQNIFFILCYSLSADIYLIQIIVGKLSILCWFRLLQSPPSFILDCAGYVKTGMWREKAPAPFTDISNCWSLFSISIQMSLLKWVAVISISNFHSLTLILVPSLAPRWYVTRLHNNFISPALQPTKVLKSKFYTLFWFQMIYIYTLSFLIFKAAESVSFRNYCIWIFFFYKKLHMAKLSTVKLIP